MIATSSSSEAPPRNGPLRSVSSIANKHVRNFPSAVRRIREQLRQKGCDTDGITPNPDMLCNREIKFKLFLEKAIREFEPAKTETIQKNGNGMPSDAMHHTPSLLPNSEAYREAPAIA